MGTLVAQHRELLRRNRKLGQELAERERCIRSLEAQVLESNQRRQDVLKRIDDLIAQIDHLDGRLGAGGR